MVNKIAIGYLIATAVYFGSGGSSIWWNGFNMASLIIPLYYFLGTTRATEWTRLAQSVTLIRGVYTFVVLVYPFELIYLSNKVLALALVIILVLKWIKRFQK